MFHTSPNKNLYAHLTTEEEVELEMQALEKRIEMTSHIKGREGLAISLALKFKVEQLGWRYGEITGIDFMNA